MVTPLLKAKSRTWAGRSFLLLGAQSMTAFFPTFATALYRRVFFASLVASRHRIVVSLGAARYDTTASLVALGILSASRTITRR